MRKIIFVILTFAVLFPALHAKVTPILNFERDGKPVLIPGVQEYRPGTGAFKMPDKFIVSLPKGEEMVLEQLEGDLKRFGISVKNSDKDAVCRFKLDEKDVPKHKEGYTLVVDSSGINVRSRSTAGLFYGAQTLCNLIRNAATPELKACAITDYPDFDIRGVCIRTIPPDQAKHIMHTLKALSALKINCVCFEMDRYFPFETTGIPKHPKAMTKAELREIVALCRKLHINVCASLQVWSHCRWMTKHPDWDKMKEGVPQKEWWCQPCPENEEAFKLTEAAINEYIEVFQPQEFSIGLDELFLGPRNVCPKCRGKDPVEQFSKVIRFAEGLLLKRGISPIVCNDSFVSHPTWKIGDKLRDVLDPRTIILYWDYRDRLDDSNLALFKKFPIIGHALWGKPLNMHNMLKAVRKYGGKGANCTHWYYSQGGMLSRLNTETPDSLGGIVNSADYMWKFTDTHYADLGYDGTFVMMRLLYPEMTAASRPRTETAQPMSLANSVNAELSDSGVFPRFASDEELTELKRILAGLPERFHLVTSPGGKYYGVRLNGDPKVTEGRQAARIHLGRRKLEGLSLLLTATRPADARSYAGGQLFGKKNYAHPRVATLCFEYADGKRTPVVLKYRDQIVDWNRPFGGFSMRFAVRGLDANDLYYSFGILDIKNPHPEKPVKSLFISSARCDGISPVLLALSAWGVDKPFAEPEKSFDPAVLAKRSGVPDNRDRALRIAADFEHGMGGVTVDAAPVLRDKIKVEIVDDPKSPSGNKVLKITVPPGNYKKGRKSDMDYLRIDVNLPYTMPVGTKALTVDHMLITSGGDLYRINNYIRTGDAENGKPAYRMHKLWPSSRWKRDIIPLWMRVSPDSKLKDYSLVRERKISYFFHRIEHPVEIRIDNIGDTAEVLSSVPLWEKGCEAEPI